MDDTSKVKVFKEHERWDMCDKWYMMPIQLLNELAVCEYEIDGKASEKHPQVKWIREQHPNCVLVY